MAGPKSPSGPFRLVPAAVVRDVGTAVHVDLGGRTMRFTSPPDGRSGSP